LPQITTHDDTAIVPAVANTPVLSEQSNRDEACRSGIRDFVVGNDMWNNAFRRACECRSAEEREKLAQTTDIRDLFESLQKEDKEHEEASLFQRGVNMVGPVLNRLNFLLNLADPVSSIEPSASSALAIVKMVTAVSVPSTTLAYLCEMVTTLLIYAYLSDIIY
jgi:hypothetical protein